jgi:hypothetical protein
MSSCYRRPSGASGIIASTTNKEVHMSEKGNAKRKVMALLSKTVARGCELPESIAAVNTASQVVAKYGLKPADFEWPKAPEGFIWEGDPGVIDPETDKPGQVEAYADESPTPAEPVAEKPKASKPKRPVAAVKPAAKPKAAPKPKPASKPRGLGKVTAVPGKVWKKGSRQAMVMDLLKGKGLHIPTASKEWGIAEHTIRAMVSTGVRIAGLTKTLDPKTKVYKAK